METHKTVKTGGKQIGFNELLVAALGLLITLGTIFIAIGGIYSEIGH